MFLILFMLMVLFPAGIEAAAPSYVISCMTASEQANVTGDGTGYIVKFPQEIFDEHELYDPQTGYFEAPETGMYHFSTAVHMGGITSSNSQIILSLTGSGIGTYWMTVCGSAARDAAGSMMISGSITVYMEQGDTAGVQIMANGSSRSIDVSGYISGYYLQYVDPDEMGGVQPVAYTSDWNGVTYENYEDYAANSTVTLWNSQGVVMTKERFTYLAGMFGIAIAAIMTWAFFKAVL